MRKTLIPLMILLLSAVSSAFAQRVDVDKKSGLITVDGKPSFYLMGKNRSLFLADYALENLQHRELAYLKALQQPNYNPVSGFTSNETYYLVTFTKTGNSCEIHGFTSLSIFKSLAKNIAAARLVQGNDISQQAEQKFIVMNNGVFLRDPDDKPGRSRYEDDRNIDREGQGSAGGSRDNRYDDRQDNRYSDRENDRYGNRPGNNRDDRDRGDDNTVPAGPVTPLNISLTGNRIYDGDELIGTYKQASGANKGETVITIFDVDSRKLATARHIASATDWSVMLADNNTKLAVRYRAESPLVRLFTFLAEKGHL